MRIVRRTLILIVVPALALLIAALATAAPPCSVNPDHESCIPDPTTTTTDPTTTTCWSLNRALTPLKLIMFAPSGGWAVYSKTP